MSNFRNRLEDVLAERPILSHPFYVRWQEGTLNQEELQGYAKEYYAFEKEFSRFVSRLHSSCDDDRLRKQLFENLKHEEEGDENHPELWLRFTDALGLARDSVQEHFHSDETENLLRVFRKHTRSDFVSDGVAALFAYESQQPEVARQKRVCLKQHYGFQNETALSFFTAHEKYDVEHSENELDILENLCTDEISQQRALSVIRETRDALHEFLDGVEKRYCHAA